MGETVLCSGTPGGAFRWPTRHDEATGHPLAKESPMPTRTAQTAWHGSLKEGSGRVELVSSGLGGYDVSWPKRTADDANGATSPEELIAAAHSACYAMSLSALVAGAGGASARPRRPRRRQHRPRPGRRLPADRHRADSAGVGRRPRGGSVPRGCRSGQGRLPGQQGAHRRGYHPGRRPRGLTAPSSCLIARRGKPPTCSA